MSRPSRSRLPFITCVGLLALAPTGVVAAPAGPDLSPAGMVAFFPGLSSCPTGWVAATSVEGRMIVGTTTAANIGGTVGSALGDLEDRTHAHGFVASTSIPAKNIAGSDGGNNQGAASGNQVISGSANAAPSNLPFVQFLACARQ